MEYENVSETGENPELEVILDVMVDVTGSLGSCRMSMREVLDLAPGTLVQLKNKVTDPVILCLNNKPVARGEVVVINDCFGIKITEMVEQ
ncbi:MAG TPA: FliM/FliN family flagellar motor switch protein [Oceanipulchritudo sp.]|nr:FliM/FliN family flagellar motor switch protein [Oceanipulchritudo sp.]